VTYTNAVGMNLSLNQLDATGTILDESFARQLDGRYLHQSSYWLAFLRGDVARMEQRVAWAAGKPGMKTRYCQ